MQPSVTVCCTSRRWPRPVKCRRSTRLATSTSRTGEYLYGWSMVERRDCSWSSRASGGFPGLRDRLCHIVDEVARRLRVPPVGPGSMRHHDQMFAGRGDSSPFSWSGTRHCRVATSQGLAADSAAFSLCPVSGRGVSAGTSRVRTPTAHRAPHPRPASGRAPCPMSGAPTCPSTSPPCPGESTLAAAPIP
jgi:hypothetical protein